MLSPASQPKLFRMKAVLYPEPPRPKQPSQDFGLHKPSSQDHPEGSHAGELQLQRLALHWAQHHLRAALWVGIGASSFGLRIAVAVGVTLEVTVS